tara:strand:+ start:1945 stop:3735 length:1791 start_codon:yes stop_codon:yes gene_type:complete
MKISFSFKNILEIIARFPLASIACVIAFSMAMIEIHDSLPRLFNDLWISSIQLCFLAIAGKLFCEAQDKPPLYGIFFSLAIFLPTFLFLESYSQSLVILASFLAMGLAPYLSKDITYKQTWTFNHRLWLQVIFAIVASTLLFSGLASIYWTITILFKISFDPYLSTAAFITFIFGPFLAMSGIPKHFKDEALDEAKFVNQSRFLFQWIIIPLLYAYAAIIYAYALFMLINWQLPQGTIVKSVLGFGIVGITTYLAIYPFDKSSKLIELFKAHFAKVSILPLVLLTMAIWIRVEEYGLTENRYLVIAGIVWGASAIYFMFKGTEHVIRNIIASLVVILFLITLTPLNGGYLSSLSQNARLAHVLEENGILVDDKIIPTEKELSVDDRIKITKITQYLVRKSYINDLKHWFRDMPDAAVNQWDKKNSPTYNSHLGVMKDMGVKHASLSHSYYKNRSKNADTKKHFEYRSISANSNLVNTQGYDFYLKRDFYGTDIEYKFNIKAKDDFIIRFVKLEQRLEITLNETDETHVIPFKNILSGLDKEKARINESDDIDLSFVSKYPKSKIKLIVNAANGYFNDDNDDINFTKLTLDILIDFE